MLYGLLVCQQNKLQPVINASAALFFEVPRFRHITPISCGIHRLPIRSRINSRIILLTFKAIYELAPKYISGAPRAEHHS